MSMVDKGLINLSVQTQCRLLGLSRSSFYYSPCKESDENLKIMRHLDERYLLTPFTGYRKLTRELAKSGYNINEKRVRRLMKKVGWNTIYREPRTTICGVGHKIYPYLLKGLSIERCNQVWVTDITYVPMARGFMYMMAIMDVHTRYIVHWSLSNTMTAEWCTETLNDAMAKGIRPEIMNTDQGSQFTSNLFTETLINNGIQISMDGKGRAIDNIFIERFWRSLKYEQIYLHVPKDGSALYQDISKYIAYYNDHRLHQSLDYCTPWSKYQPGFESSLAA